MAPRSARVQLYFPIGGINKGLALSQQPPMTTPDALNVRPESVGLSVAGDIEPRRRGGSRPGTGRFYQGFQFGDGSPVRLIQPYNPISANTQKGYVDGFNGSGPNLLSAWRQAPWLYTPRVVSAISAVGTTVTVQTATAHGLSVGESFTLSGITPNGYNGIFRVVTVPDTDEVTFVLPSALAPPVLGATPRLVKYAMPGVFPEDASKIRFAGHGGAVRNAIEDIDPTKPYIIRIRPIPYFDQHWGKYYIYARMLDDGNFGALDATFKGIIAELDLRAGTSPSATGNYSGELREYFDGNLIQTASFATGSTSTPDIEWFQLIIEETRIRVSWGSVQLADIAVGPGGGYAFGFGMEANATGDRVICLIDSIELLYYQPRIGADTVGPLSDVLVSAGGNIYRENEPNLSVEQIDSPISLNADRSLNATQYQGNVFIADFGSPKADIQAADIDDKVITSSQVTDWLALGIDINSDVVQILNGSSGVIDGVYEIEQVGEEAITLKEQASTVLGVGDITILRSPKYYDSNLRRLRLWNADYVDESDPTQGRLGIMPVGCPLIATFRDRLVLAGAQQNPFAWYMSRQQDPFDWDYAADDIGGAVAGATSAAGFINGPLTALIPHSDDYLLFCTPDSIYVMRGDPRVGGILDSLSRSVGCAGKKAWCYGPSGEVLIFSYTGIYILQPGPGMYPQNVSSDPLPDDLSIPDIDRDKYEVRMEYDASDLGVHIWICKTVNDGTAGVHYWMDWRTKGFFRVVIPIAHEPFATATLAQRYGKDSSILIGGRDGYIRAYRNAFETDDGIPYDSHVFIGPIGNPVLADTQIKEITGSMTEDSGAVKWELYGGDTIQAALESTTPVASGTWNEDRNYLSRPNVRHRWLYLKLSNQDPDQHWAIEIIEAVLQHGGKTRLL